MSRRGRASATPRRRRSPYLHDDGDIQVRRDPDNSTGRTLVHRGMEASYVDLADPTHLEFSYVRRIRDLLDATVPVRRPLHVLHVGGGGCTLPRYLEATRAQARSEVFEADPAVLDVARKLLGLRTSARLRVRLGDAREAIAARPDASADVVVGDAFVDGLVPAHLSTAEFTADVARVLGPDGLYVLNVVDAGGHRITRRVAAGFLPAFAEVALVGPRRLLAGRGLGNLLLIGAQQPLPLDRLRVRAARDDEPTEVRDREAVVFFAAGARPYLDAEVGWPPVEDAPAQA